MGGTNGAAAALGGSIYIALGMIAIESSTLLGNLRPLTTDVFLQLWAETVLMAVLGLSLLIAAFLGESENDFRQIVGMPLGVLASMFGAIVALVLLNTAVGLTSAYSLANAQLSVAQVFLVVGTFVTVLVGFPLGIVGSLRLFHKDTTQSQEQT